MHFKFGGLVYRSTSQPLGKKQFLKAVWAGSRDQLWDCTRR